MKLSEWYPIYERILTDMGYVREEDENSVRVLKSVTVNSDLTDPDDVRGRFGDRATVAGSGAGLEDSLTERPTGVLITAGSATERVMRLGIIPDVVVTDLDGDVYAQAEASARGALTFIHAHGDNCEAIRMHAWKFSGPVILTTQSVPGNTVFNFGGFTDGDRAVCIAQEMGCTDIRLIGFDFDNPFPKDGTDMGSKLRKLRWAKEIIDSLTGVSITYA